MSMFNHLYLLFSINNGDSFNGMLKNKTLNLIHTMVLSPTSAPPYLSENKQYLKTF